MSPKLPVPPVAERHPHTFTRHGITVTDDYAWLKDDNWQEVLRDPSVLKPNIRAYLEAENAYADAVLGHTAPLQKKLIAEMRGRIKEDDSSVPSPDGPFAYFHKYREGGQHEQIGRLPRQDLDNTSGQARFIIDGDEVAKQSEYFKFGGARHSPDHKLEAWSADVRGSEYFTIRVRDWETGTDSADVVEETDGGIVWSATTTGQCRSIATRSARRSPTTLWSMKNRTPAGSPISTRAPADASASSPAVTTRPPNSG
jgi:oligopeptidase B